LARECVRHGNDPAICKRIEVKVDLFWKYMLGNFAAPDKIYGHNIRTFENIMECDRNHGALNVVPEAVNPMSKDAKTLKKSHCMTFSAPHIQNRAYCKALN
jgi:hypothetical protein